MSALEILRDYVKESAEKGATNHGTYSLGNAHGKLDADTVYKKMDCSSFASRVLMEVLGKDSMHSLTTKGFHHNPFGFQRVDLDFVKNLKAGELIQFNWTGKNYGHTGFFYRDESTGKLAVVDFRGGKHRKLVIQDADAMLKLAVRRGAKFFLIDNTKASSEYVEKHAGKDLMTQFGALFKSSSNGVTTIPGPMAFAALFFGKQSGILHMYMQEQVKKDEDKKKQIECLTNVNLEAYFTEPKPETPKKKI